MENFEAILKKWYAKPYDDDNDVIEWIMFIGFMTAVTILWTRVIRSVIN